MDQSLSKCETQCFFVVTGHAPRLAAVELEDKGGETACDIEVVERHNVGVGPSKGTSRTGTGQGGGAFTKLLTEQREGDYNVDVRTLDDALHMRVWLTCQVNCGGLNVESEGHIDWERNGESLV